MFLFLFLQMSNQQIQDKRYKIQDTRTNYFWPEAKSQIAKMYKKKMKMKNQPQVGSGRKIMNKLCADRQVTSI